MVSPLKNRSTVPGGQLPSAAGRDGIRFRLLRPCPAKRIKRGSGWASSTAIQGAIHLMPELLWRVALMSFVEDLAGDVPNFRNVAVRIPHIE
ncbi:hypothetical protein [Ralstonia solanacearum]|uniref:hypothetical protein n=1 Tax=Ralstonia solanacearum TaxID=305 RepID=UPI003D272B21